MTTSIRRIFATALVLSMHMILQCSGITPNSQLQTTNTITQKHEQNFTNQPLDATTLYPENPYVFSVEDYDGLQDAESLHHALSIVAYEPQKINAKKTKRKIANHDEIIKKNTSAVHTTTPLPLEKKYYEVPRKQLRTQAHVKLDRGSEDINAYNTGEKASLLKRAHEIEQQNSRTLEIYHNQPTNKSMTPPSTRFIAKTNNEIISTSPFLPSCTSQTQITPSTNSSKPMDNYHTASRSTNDKDTQKDNQTFKIQENTPTVKKKRHKNQKTLSIEKRINFQPHELMQHRNQHEHQQNHDQRQQYPQKQRQKKYQDKQHQHKQQYNDQERQQRQKYNLHHTEQNNNLLVAKDRIPRPFSLPTNSVSNKDASTTSKRLEFSNEDIYRSPTKFIEQIHPQPKVSRQNKPRHNLLQESFDYLTDSLKPKIDGKLLKQEESVAYSVTPEEPPKNNPYSTIPVSSQERDVSFQKIPLRHTTVRQNVPAEFTTEARLPIPLEQVAASSIIPRKKENFTANTIPRRSENVNSPTKREQTRSIVSTGQKQIFKQDTSTIPTKQDPPYSTRQETLNHHAYTPRRNSQRNSQNIQIESEEIHSTVPAKQAPPHSSIPLRRKSIHQNIQQNENAASPTTFAKQNIDYSTSDKPVYVSKNLTRHRGGKKYNSAVVENNNDQKHSPSQNKHNDSNKSVYNPDNRPNKNDDDDNKGYSYSYVERYEEPIEDASTSQQDHTYKVKEDDSDYPENASQQAYSAPKRVIYKSANTDYDQDQVQYAEVQEKDADYDQARGQNLQLEVAEAQHRPRGDKEDLQEEADHLHKKHHKPKKEHREEEGGAEEHHEGEHHEHGEKGEKGYEEFHEQEEGEKGHHDKEGHDHHYNEKEGDAKEHHDEAGFHEEHEKGEEGEKKAAFSEKGDHKKGHSTKGEHVIHKKNEFEKKTEFFDEFHEGGELDKDGGYDEEYHHKKGGHYKKGHEHEDHHENKHGKKGKHHKGHHHHEKKGHDEHEGHDHRRHHEEHYGKKGAHEDAKHWHGKKGDKR